MGFFSDVVDTVKSGVNTFYNAVAAPATAAGKLVGQGDLVKSAFAFTNPINYLDAGQRKNVLIPSVGKTLPLGASVLTGSPIPAALAYGPNTLNKFGIGGSQKLSEYAALIASGDTSAISDLVSSNLFPNSGETPNAPGYKLQAAQDFGGAPVKTTNWILIVLIVSVPVLLYFVFRKRKGK